MTRNLLRDSNEESSTSYRKIRRKFASFQVTLGLLLLFIIVSIWEPETSPSIALPHGSSSLKSWTEEELVARASNKVVYVGKYGLGHRLGKMAGAFHVAQKLQSNVSQSTPLLVLPMEIQWGVCQDGDLEEDKGGKIFDYLFGSNIILIGKRSTQKQSTAGSEVAMNKQRSTPKELWIRNDCHGYYIGQSYKNLRIPIPSNYLIDEPSLSPWFHKMDSDAKLFRRLQKRFLKMHSEPIEFMEQHKFQDHTVLGLHIRAGNGETEHFVSANRTVINEEKFLQNILRLLETFLQRIKETSANKPPLLFLATDTPTVIPIIESAAKTWNVPVATFPQPQLPPSAGVTYSAVKVGQPCLIAWRAMMADTVLLSHADVLIAGMRSSFTQIMPMSMVLNGIISLKNEIQLQSTTVVPRFCEVSSTGLAMTCVQDRHSWMVRNAINQWTLTVDTNQDTAGGTPLNSRPVIHKVVVHFPDVDGDVETRLERTLSFFQDSGQTGETLSMTWGEKLIDLKYRQRLKGVEDVPEWTNA